MSTPAGTVGCERDGPGATVTLDAPARLDAFNVAMWLFPESADHRQSVAAFVGKRRPVFAGK